jgi:hypothetical protein
VLYFVCILSVFVPYCFRICFVFVLYCFRICSVYVPYMSHTFVAFYMFSVFSFCIISVLFFVFLIIVCFPLRRGEIRLVTLDMNDRPHHSTRIWHAHVICKACHTHVMRQSTIVQTSMHMLTSRASPTTGTTAYAIIQAVPMLSHVAWGPHA